MHHRDAVVPRPSSTDGFPAGRVLGIKNDVGAEMLETTPANFRQILSRSRRELYAFLEKQCGIANHSNPCRCEKKARGFIEIGIVRTVAPRFVSDRVAEIQKIAPDRFREIQYFERRFAELFRNQPLLKAPDQAARLRELFAQTGIKRSLEMGS